MTQYTTSKYHSRGGVPRLAMINDISGFGRCSATVSLPVISAIGVQVCPVPTSILSNHLGFPICHMDDYTPHMRDYILTWKQLGLSFDGLYCGFLGNEAQIAIVEEFLDIFRPPLFLLDPVMGDHGKKYSSVTEAHCIGLRRLACRADILTPNLTEACLLAGIPYEGSDLAGFDLSGFDLSGLQSRLTELCPGDLVITGLRQGNFFLNICREKGLDTVCRTPVTGRSRPGTGDLFASVLVAEMLHGREFAPSVRKAAEFVALCIKGTEDAHIPVQEGVLFEKYLRELM